MNNCAPRNDSLEEIEKCWEYKNTSMLYLEEMENLSRPITD